jgi:uncharacterized protein YdhG (YjbR/CyaY superfamily)
VPSAPNVDAYLASLPPDRRAAITAVRDVITRHLPEGYEEGMQYGMIAYYVPKSLYPAGYHANPEQPLGFAALGSQKSHMALYLMCVYGDGELNRWFVDEYKKTGKKLDMGKACVRFKKLDDLPLDLVGRTVARVPVAAYVAKVEAMLAETKARKATAKPKAAAKPKATAKPKKA